MYIYRKLLAVRSRICGNEGCICWLFQDREWRMSKFCSIVDSCPVLLFCNKTVVLIQASFFIIQLTLLIGSDSLMFE